MSSSAKVLGAIGSRDALRRLVAGHEAAAQAARRVDEVQVISPEAAFDAALDLWSVCSDLLSQPPDRVRLEDEQIARSAWARLRAAYGH